MSSTKNPSSAIDGMAVANVRLALLQIRKAWFREFSPETPFVMGTTIHMDTGRSLTFTEFARLFEFGHHLKRHHKSTNTPMQATTQG